MTPFGRAAARLAEGRITEVTSGAEFTPRKVQTQEERVNPVFRVGIAIASPAGWLEPACPSPP